MQKFSIALSCSLAALGLAACGSSSSSPSEIEEPIVEETPEELSFATIYAEAQRLQTLEGYAALSEGARNRIDAFVAAGDSGLEPTEPVRNDTGEYAGAFVTGWSRNGGTGNELDDLELMWGELNMVADFLDGSLTGALMPTGYDSSNPASGERFEAEMSGNVIFQGSIAGDSFAAEIQDGASITYGPGESFQIDVEVAGGEIGGVFLGDDSGTAAGVVTMDTEWANVPGETFVYEGGWLANEE